MTPTITAPGLVQLTRAGVEAFSRQRAEPDWLLHARLAAWDRYEALPKPTTRDKGWKRTDISRLDLDRLAAPFEGAAAPSQGDLSTAIGESAEQSGLLVLRNGLTARLELDDQLARRGVLIMRLADAVRDYPQLVRDHLSRRQVSPTESKLDALAAALWTEGVLVYVPRGVTLEAPIQLVHWNDAPGATLSQTLIIAEEASSVSLVSSYTSPEGLPESLASGESTSSPSRPPASATSTSRSATPRTGASWASAPSRRATAPSPGSPSSSAAAQAATS